MDGAVYHYRDNNGLECDSVLHLRNGHYGLIEIKLGGNSLIEEGAILTGTGQYAYQREDGVLVVPIGCLRP